MIPMLIALSVAGTALGSATDQLVPGTITIERSEPDGAHGPGDEPFTEAVQRALLRTSFTPLPVPGHSRYIVRVAVSRHERGLVASGIKPAAPAASVANWGGGVNVSLPTKNDSLRGLVVTELTVTVLNRADQHAVWRGSAVTAQVEGTRAGAPEAVAEKLASGLLAHFPLPMIAPLSIP